MRQCLKQISANKGVCCFFLVTEVAFETSEDGNLVDISGLLQTFKQKNVLS
mgnify:FL=1